MKEIETNPFPLNCITIFLLTNSMKILFSLLTVVLATTNISAQYYYNDILNIRKLNAEYASIRSAGNHLIVLKSFEEDDSPSDGFFCEKKFNKDFSASSMISKSYITGEAVLNAVYKDGRIVKAVNETPTTTNTTTYAYDSAGNLLSVSTMTLGNADSATFSEVRTYEYDQHNLPLQMKKSRDGKQLATIHFVKDEKGNIIEETPQAGSDGRKYYYYYDEQNMLTDIVHYNEIAKKLLPDFMFLYDENGILKQMISVDETARNYLIWKYAYTQNGLPEIQKCYSKEKRLLGTIQYEYR